MKKSEKYNIISWITLGIAAGFLFVALITSFTYSTVNDDVLRLIVFGLISTIIAGRFDRKKLIAEIEEILNDFKKKNKIL